MARGAVTELPASLAPWARELSLFPRELAIDLGTIVRRVAALVGDASPQRAGSGDPDGFEGLARRGSYERLLQSEWLIAEELPDEFARRAVMHEHLFLELARTHPLQHPLSVALFDAGASQIGAPRLLQMAALIVLARRAAASQSTFRWGVVQVPGKLHDAIVPATIRRFLDAKTAREASAQHVADWLDALEREDERVGEMWFIGAPRMAALPQVREQWHLAIEDVVEPGVRQIRAEVRHQSRTQPPIVLELPRADRCVRLLRNPFEGASATPGQTPEAARITSDLVFGNGGRVVMGRAPNGDLVVQPFGNFSRRVPTIEPAWIVPANGGRVLAAGWERGRHPIVVFAEGDRIRVQRGQNPEWRVFGREGDLFPATDAAPLQPCIGVPSHSQLLGGVLFIDAARQLWHVADTGGFGQLSENVFALRRSNQTYHWLRRFDTRWIFSSGLQGEDTIVDNAGSRAFFNFAKPSDARGGEGGIVALERANGRYIALYDGVIELAPPPGTIVIGASVWTWAKTEPALVWLEEDRRTITRGGRSGSHKLFESVAPIAHANLSAISPHLGCVTERGELAVISMANGTRLVSTNVVEGTR